MALCSHGSKLTLGGLTLFRNPSMVVLACSFASSGTCFRPFSTAVAMLAVGIVVGTGANFLSN